MPKKKISDYLTNWHKAILALIFFVGAGVWVMALAGEVKQNSQEIQKINLWRQNQLIWEMEAPYKCYKEEECLAKMPEEIRKQYRELLEERKTMYEKVKAK